MSNVAEPNGSTWQISRRASLPFSSVGSTQLSTKEQHSSTTSTASDLFNLNIFTPPKTELPKLLNQADIRSSTNRDFPNQDMQPVATANALGLHIDGKFEATAGEPILCPFLPDMHFAGGEEACDDDEDAGWTGSDLEGTLPEEDRLKTAAEDRADKRRMKRFRLTHGQTRFLQSEFARQAHPDSAQRDRLSREIPGLSPRQVQVWFQNRRAKMKRLLGDDRERMIKSRAVPEGFDTARVLRSPYLRSPQYGGIPMNAEEDHVCHFSSNDTSFPREGNLIGSPSSISSNPDSFYAAASSVSTSAAMSPVSSLHEKPFLPDCTFPPKGNPHPINRYSRSLSFPQVYHALPRPPNYSDQEQASRRRAGSLASPLGVDYSYAEVGWDHSSPRRFAYASPNHYPYTDLQNSFGAPEQSQFTAVQNIFAPEIQLNISSEKLWSDCQIYAPAPPPPRQPNIAELYPEFGIPSQSSRVADVINGLHGLESKTVQETPALLMAETDGASTADRFYPHINPTEPYLCGFRNPFPQ